MPITYPIQSATGTTEQKPRNWALVVSLRNSYRSLDAAVVTLVHKAFDLWLPAATPSEIDGLLAYSLDPRNGADIATVVTGGAEVHEACIEYRDLDVGETNARLRSLGIVVREAVLPLSDGH